MGQTILIIGAIVEIILLVGIIIVGKEVWWRAKDYNCFNRIVTGEFIFSPRYYNENKKALVSYIHAYLNYGYNVKCEMTEEEFISSLTKFMKKFSKHDHNRDKTVQMVLDNICTDVRKGLKLKDENCKLRARYLMKRVERIYAEELNSDDEDIADAEAAFQTIPKRDPIL